VSDERCRGPSRDRCRGASDCRGGNQCSDDSSQIVVRRNRGAWQRIRFPQGAPIRPQVAASCSWRAVGQARSSVTTTSESTRERGKFAPCRADAAGSASATPGRLSRSANTSTQNAIHGRCVPGYVFGYAPVFPCVRHSYSQRRPNSLSRTRGARQVNPEHAPDHPRSRTGAPSHRREVTRRKPERMPAPMTVAG